jgi:hypothetical protein
MLGGACFRGPKGNDVELTDDRNPITCGPQRQPSAL